MGFICREHGISETTFQVWKKYAGLALRDLRELRELRPAARGERQTQTSDRGTVAGRHVLHEIVRKTL